MNTLIKREYDYALRICAYLAGNYNQGIIPISKLAKLLFLTKPFTTKIIFLLKKQNIVTTVQGKDGGVRLTNDPEHVSVYDVLAAMGYDSRLNECLAVGHQCPMEDICRLHVFFGQQEEKLIESFKAKKLSQVTITDSQLKKTTGQ